MSDISIELHQRVQQAHQTAQPVSIVGGNSKAFYGRHVEAEKISLREHQGIISYEPTELVMHCRSGTLLRDVEKILDENNQCLAFDPPHFGDTATVGGMVACGFAGPRRAYTGSVRDMVLGLTLINGVGEILTFGGQVMKNVAGYDVSRLVTGSLGTLGIILDVSLKVLPKPKAQTTLVFENSAEQALTQFNQWRSKPLCIDATCYYDKHSYVRLAGSAQAIASAQQQLGGDVFNDAEPFWQSIKEQQHAFFSDKGTTLWRLSLPSHSPLTEIDGEQLIEWSGSQRWLASNASVETIREQALAQNGHATVFRAQQSHDIPFQPLTPALLKLHTRLKDAFDPKRILNPGKMYAEL